MAADSLSAIKYATVKPVRDHTGLAVDFIIEGDYPQYGNNDDRVDSIACDLVERFMKKIRALPTYRNAVPTHRSRPSPPTWFTARRPATRRTDVAAARRLRPAPTRCTGATERGGGVVNLGRQAAVHLCQRRDFYTFSIVPQALGKRRAGAQNQPCRAAGRILPPRSDH